MPSINLLPWRQELRKRRQREFAIGAVAALALALIVSLLAMIFAFGTALISGFIDTRIYDQDDLRRWGELPELPFIPDLHYDGPVTRSGASASSAPPPA